MKTKFVVRIDEFLEGYMNLHNFNTELSRVFFTYMNHEKNKEDLYKSCYLFAQISDTFFYVIPEGEDYDPNLWHSLNHGEAMWYNELVQGLIGVVGGQGYIISELTKWLDCFKTSQGWETMKNKERSGLEERFQCMINFFSDFDVNGQYSECIEQTETA